MAVLKKLTLLLDLPDSDFWYDVASCEARSILDDGGEAFLSQVLAEWLAWPEMRQEHLAYILGEGPSPIEKQILEEMACLPRSDVAFRARESLRSNYSKPWTFPS